MRRKWFRYVLAFLLAATVTTAAAQTNAFNRGRTPGGGGSGNSQSAFNSGRSNSFNEYRQRLNAEYIRASREAWRDFRGNAPMEDPFGRETPVAPVRDDGDHNRELQSNPIEIEEVVPINNRPAPAPRPVVPIGDGDGEATRSLDFEYIGTPMSVRLPQSGLPRLRSVEEGSIADAWQQLCTPGYDALISDCLALRSSRKLCDWAYLQMLTALGKAAYGRDCNEATLLAAYVYSLSGYRMRLARAAGTLVLLYASEHNIYNRSYYEMDGQKYYPLNSDASSLNMCAARYPKERSLSLTVGAAPNFEFNSGNARTITSQRYPSMQATISCNKNLIDFYNTYPSSEVGGNFMTRWAMYANTAIGERTRSDLYSQLRGHLAGKSELQAVEMLLNWVQTGFVYEYDDRVWGGDRALFAEETLYYPYSDCEDRSILFTRLVRDLVGLDCILIYYPGHLAAAVNFGSDVAGDYLMLNGRKYVVSDPTYIGAAVGRTMPGMNNASAKVILLR